MDKRNRADSLRLAKWWQSVASQCQLSAVQTAPKHPPGQTPTAAISSKMRQLNSTEGELRCTALRCTVPVQQPTRLLKQPAKTASAMPLADADQDREQKHGQRANKDPARRLQEAN